MSNNLLKSNWFVVNGDNTRMIDTNELVEQKIEKLNALLKKENAVSIEGFTEGLDLERVQSLLDDEADLLTGENIIRRPAEPFVKVPDYDEVLEKVMSDVQSEIEDMKNAALSEIEMIKKNAMEAGKKEGFMAGQAEALKTMEAAKNELILKEKELQEQYEHKIQELEPLMVDTLTGIYEHVFKIDLVSKRELIINLIENTMQKIEGTRDFLIHVAKDDYAYVSMNKKQISANVTANSTVEIIEDLTLNKGECLIETGGGIFDCGINTHLEELTKALKLLSYEN